MKFCLISENNFSEAIGGAEIQCKYIAEELIKRGHRVFYIYKSSIKKKSFIENGICFEPIFIPKFINIILIKIILLKLVVDYFYLYKAMKRIQADYWYYRSANSYLISITSIKNRLGGKLIYALSMDIQSYKNFWIKKFGCFFHKKYIRSLSSIDYFIFQKYSQKIEFYNQYLYDGIVIYNGHPIYQNITKLNSPDLSSSSLKLLWIGNLKEIKQPELFIELVEKLQNPLIEFFMVGRQNDKYKDLINETSKKFKNFHFYDQLDNSVVLKMISSSYLTICTSYSEGFPNVFIESWQFGVPVMSFVDPDDLIVKHQLGFKCNDIKEMITKIEYLIANYDIYQNLKANCLKIFEKHFRIDKNIDYLLKHIGE